MCAFNAKTETAKLPETRPLSCAQAERFKLTCFLLGNRCPPTVLVDWYLMRGCLHDEAAKMNVAAVLKQHLEGKLEKYTRRGSSTQWLRTVTTRRFTSTRS